jgi:2-succinyl-6-hydroxy-2,4-cyclohexadiene-1-carboxylate synthase
LIAVDLWASEHDLPLRAWAGTFNRRVSAVDSDPVLLGYSMGARLALHALVEPEAPWKAAILVSPHPGLFDAASRGRRRRTDDEWLRRFDTLDWPEFWAEWTAQPVLADSRQRPVPPARGARKRCLAFWSLAEQDDLRPEFERIRCPVLWITGEHDDKYTVIGTSAARLMPDCEQVVVAGIGHRVPWDAPGEFYRLVEDFLRRLPGGNLG